MDFKNDKLKEMAKDEAKNAAEDKALDKKSAVDSSVNKALGEDAGGIVNNATDTALSGGLEGKSADEIKKQVAEQAEAEAKDRAQTAATDEAARASAKLEDKYGKTGGVAGQGLEAVAEGDFSGNSDQIKDSIKSNVEDKATDAVETEVDSAVSDQSDQLAEKADDKVSGAGDVVEGGADAASENLSGNITNKIDGSKKAIETPEVATPSAPSPTSAENISSDLGNTASDNDQTVEVKWAPAPKGLNFAPNVVNKLVFDLAKGDFTLKQLADKLIEIESAQGYEMARFVSRQLDYETVCNIRDFQEPDNDPNIMPTRFLILPDADDESLEENGCLDDIPWDVHPDGPQKLSVAFLKECLTLTGHFKEGAAPTWQSDGLESPEGEQTSAPAPANIPGTSGERDVALKDAFMEYLSEAQPEKTVEEELPQSTYTVEAGDSLSKIAHEKGYPHWQVIFEANKGSIKNPDVIYVGQQIKLPALSIGDIDQWFSENKAPDGLRSKQNYRFPAHYFSLSLVDDQDTLLESEDGWVFEAYTKNPAHLFYHFKLGDAEQLKVLLPDGENVSVGFGEDHFQCEGVPAQPYKEVANAAPQEQPTETTDDESDEDYLYDDLPMAEEEGSPE